MLQDLAQPSLGARGAASGGPAMNADAIGYLAAGLVFATFCMRSMVPLRLIAIASNFAFLGYGYLGQLTPVLVLHSLLLVVNVFQLLALLQGEGTAAARRSPGR